MVKETSIEISGIGFSAGHFVSEGGKCERLHGHNYQVSVRISGEINSQGMVIDFRVIKEHLRLLCKEWDHRLLLPAYSSQIKISARGEKTEVKTPDREYSFPSKDVLILDVTETTAEELARILAQRLGEILKQNFPNVHQIGLSVAESITQRATVVIDL
ncbi:MAG: 6-pyruvoyl tetrahydropterin synthase family protein [Promethearchaeota archaeon]